MIQAMDEDDLAWDGPISIQDRSRLGRAVDAIDAVFDGLSEKLMVFFLVPLCVGLVYRLRYEAGLAERVLMIAVVVVNVGLMFGRHMWLGPQSVGRYSVGMIALSTCYIPTGLAVMARWLRGCADRIFGDRGRPELGERVWFGVLLAVGVAICLPKLLRPMHAGSQGGRDVAVWLREHTVAKDIIAVPDGRIVLYAGRQGRLYHQWPDPRQADYVVILKTKGSSGPPKGWDERYSCWANERQGTRWVVYRVE
jgi:hypothetical protein